MEGIKLLSQRYIFFLSCSQQTSITAGLFKTDGPTPLRKYVFKIL